MTDVLFDYHYCKEWLSDQPLFGTFKLHQIGRAYCTPGAVIPTHVHPNLFELTIATGGSGTVYTNSVASHITAGEIYLSFPADMHKIVSDEDTPLKFDFFAFNSVDPAMMQALEELISANYLPENRVFRDERIAQAVANAIPEVDSPQPDSEALLCSIFSQLLLYLLRDFREKKPEKQTGQLVPAEILCRKIMNYIDTHIYSIHSLEEVAQHFGYSYNYLSTLFRTNTSTTLRRYYCDKKLNTARYLLRNKNLKVTDIAEMLNYSSVYAFGKAFRLRFGISPRNSRKENK